jgi:hypothetical protein
VRRVSGHREEMQSITSKIYFPQLPGLGKVKEAQMRTALGKRCVQIWKLCK